MGRVTRRCLLKRIAAAGVFAPAVLTARRAHAALPVLPNLPPSDALLLRPGDAQFAAYQPAFNSRTMLTPQLRALCKTAHAVGVMIDWCRSNSLPFALRSGGHCYEGLSQSTSVVIDTRMIDAVTVDAKAKTAAVGAGASLGDVYRAVAARGLALPAGSCPTVGVAGHVLGGGYGYLARPFGLACDSLVSIDLIDPQGRQVRADAQQNSDLFWACRGGGGGSFGAVVAFRFRLHDVGKVLVFHVSLQYPPERAAKVIKDWQAWAPQAPQSITAILVISRHPGGGIDLHCMGQSVGQMQQLRRELKVLSSSPQIETMSFFAAVNHFAGPGGWTYPSVPMKGKSDYVNSPLTDAGLSMLTDEIGRRSDITVICNPYDGAIAATAPDATAFAHRRGTLFSLQYTSVWTDPKVAQQRLSDMRDFYAAMRPYVSGAAYVNYCDLDLTDWPTAYWGQNLARLKQIKAVFDPDNVFRHAQSIPPA
jgi:FAD/FMN-containing dehydrogenase